MPILFVLLLSCLAPLASSHAQANPCHCLKFGLHFHDGEEDLAFEPVGKPQQQDGQWIQVYQETHLERLKAIAVLDMPPKKSSPTLESLELDPTQAGITLFAQWFFDLEKAYHNQKACAQKTQQSLGDLHLFDFLPPMNQTINLQVYLLYDLPDPAWPLPEEDIAMKVHLSLPAHPFYSDWNAQSPFKMQLPYLQTKLAYIKGQQWKVWVEDGIRVVQELERL